MLWRRWFDEGKIRVRTQDFVLPPFLLVSGSGLYGGLLYAGGYILPGPLEEG